MTGKTDNLKQPLPKVVSVDEASFPASLSYPVQDDIYNKSQQEEDIDPEDTSKLKAANQNDELEGLDKDESGADMDVPGSELDDDQENVGSEDEENNSYSLGGDNHNDLEENRGE